MKSKVSLSQSLLTVSFVVIIFCTVVILFLVLRLSVQNFYSKQTSPQISSVDSEVVTSSYQINIIKETKENKNFRHVLFTGRRSQLVVMNIPAGGEVGEEVHKYSEQTLFFLSGTAEAILNDKKFPVVPGDVVVVTAGTKHNFINTGKEDLKIYTVYAPANHIDGRIHHTKAEADADKADEAIGESAPLN